MEHHESEDPTTRLVKAILGSFIFVTVGVFLWDRDRGVALLSIVVFGGCALVAMLALVFPGMRLEVRCERRLAELERSGALESVKPERVRVWSALSELYLDTEVGDLVPGIAATLAASPYGERELREILADEVGPVVWVNMLSVAGVWTGFDEKWLTREILARGRGFVRRVPVLREVPRFLVTFMVLRDWHAVARRVRELRESSAAPHELR
jgi:hypothetical protein